MIGMGTEALYGGIETGGTKSICVVGSGPDRILDQVRIPTTTPHETLGQTIEFFQPYVRSRKVKGIGIGSFGPLDLDPASPTYGFITATPKPGWSNTDLAGILGRALETKIAMDTDVNAAALGEHRWGAGAGLDPLLYVTIGTGIGGGYIRDGAPLSGMTHTEMGHIRIPHDRERDPFPGACPFHEDCFEGLAGGTAIQQRFDEPGEIIPDDDPFWDVEAGYIADALMNYILVTSPRRIILGGGVMQRKFLFPAIRDKVRAALNDYVAAASLTGDLAEYIVAPALAHQSGVLGALALAMGPQRKRRRKRPTAEARDTH